MININDDILEVLISSEDLTNRCKEIAEEINEEYQDKDPVLVCLLKGSIPFLAELLKYITIPMEFECMRVSSYHGTKSSGIVNISAEFSTPLKKRDVIIVEDIVDSGRTIAEVTKIFKASEVNSIVVASLLDKPEMRLVEGIHPKYIGFEVPNKFVVGFGLDYNQKYRNLPYIGVLKPEIYEK